MKKTKTALPIRPRKSRVIGYVVRYENGGERGEPSQPLHYEEVGLGLALWISYHKGTVFTTLPEAKTAIRASVKHQQKHGLIWNEMYGPYLIDPVVVA